MGKKTKRRRTSPVRKIRRRKRRRKKRSPRRPLRALLPPPIRAPRKRRRRTRRAKKRRSRRSTLTVIDSQGANLKGQWRAQERHWLLVTRRLGASQSRELFRPRVWCSYGIRGRHSGVPLTHCAKRVSCSAGECVRGSACSRDLERQR